jgi:hypothetical protein
MLYTNVYFCFEDNDGALAVFPDLKERNGSFLCYAKIGQHSTCTIHYIKEKTEPLKEFQELKKELESIGYLVNPVDSIE